MASPRSTFKGSAADLAAIVVRHALVDGKSFLRYCERQPCKVATMDVDKFEKHALLASDLHKLQPNMSFKKAITAKALQLAGKELNKEFGFTPAQLQDWTTTMAARLRSFAFHISTGMRKHPQCRWVLALPWNQKGDTDAAAPASDDRELEDCSRSQVARRVSSKTPSASWSNSWSTELGLPVRVRGVGKHEVREVGLPVRSRLAPRMTTPS